MKSLKNNLTIQQIQQAILVNYNGSLFDTNILLRWFRPVIFIKHLMSRKIKNEIKKT